MAALADWPVSAALRTSPLLYPIVNAMHIAALGVLIGAIATLDLRLLGAFGRYPAAVLAPPLATMAAIGLAIALVTGFLLFSVRPAEYLQNPAFLAKLALVAAGTINALLVRASAQWRSVLAGEEPRAGLRAMAAVSLAIWLCAVLAGRWIGFV